MANYFFDKRYSIKKNLKVLVSLRKQKKNLLKKMILFGFINWAV